VLVAPMLDRIALATRLRPRLCEPRPGRTVQVAAERLLRVFTRFVSRRQKLKACLEMLDLAHPRLGAGPRLVQRGFLPIDLVDHDLDERLRWLAKRGPGERAAGQAQLGPALPLGCIESELAQKRLERVQI